MSKKLWPEALNSHWALAFFSGLCLILAGPPIAFWPAVFVFPALFNLLVLRTQKVGLGFWWGFFTSFVSMVGLFYWVTYVIHMYGDLSWGIACLLYLGFCGFAALNFPIFMAAAVWLQEQIDRRKPSRLWGNLWYILGLPALFTLIEYFVPKLFPWTLGAAFYKTPWLSQTSELTGLTFSTFAIYSTSSFLTPYLVKDERLPRPYHVLWLFPLTLWIFTVGFSLERIHDYAPDGKTLNVALIQANIGSLEKRAAEGGIRNAVVYTLDHYESLTNQAMQQSPKPNLIVWPETAVPFQLVGTGVFAERVLNMARRWDTAFITGAYAPVTWDYSRDYNAAYLLEPGPDGRVIRDSYDKNILLAFGEYMPLGDTFPILYKWFPEVSNFAHGTRQNAFTLRDGTRLGMTICYEDLMPHFFRRVAANHINAIINISNDSWFGPTSEPYQHAAVASFRAIELRVPLVRVTNTGVSLMIDSLGRMTEAVGPDKEGDAVLPMHMPKDPPLTLYAQYGDWPVFILLAIVGSLVVVLFMKKHASLSI